jgi:4-amino-4-deoxy-L-arabinose transferase-like glycosyltransferase
MDFPDAQTPPARPPRALAAAGIALLALALYGALLARNVGAVAGGSDSSGYMNQARLLASGAVHVQARAIPGLPQRAAPPFLYAPLGFRPAWNGDGLAPTYPAGVALLVLALEPLAGREHAGDLMINLHSLAGLAATFALGRALGLGGLWSALAAAILAVSPLYLFSSLQAMSDIPSLAWTTLAVLAALSSRRQAFWALAAGAAVAADVLMRPTNVLAFIPVAVGLGASPRRWALLAIGGLPGAAFFFAYSHAAYGSFLATGYGDDSGDFGARFILETLRHYSFWLPALLTPVVALNLALPWVASVSARTRLLLAAWMLAFAAFFSTYKCTHETWWYLRFLLPAFPAMAVGSLLVLRAAVLLVPTRALRGESFAGFAAVLALAAAFSLGLNGPLHPLSIGDEELLYARVAGWIRSNAPGEAVCLSRQASGALFYYTGVTVLRWDFVDKGNVGRIESAIQRSRRPLYAVLFPIEYTESRLPGSAMPGRWRELVDVDGVKIMRRDFDAPKS